MDRKSFIKRTLSALLAGIPLLAISSCGDDDDDDNNDTTPEPTTSNDCGANGTDASISNNHGHTIEVSKGDVAAGVEKNYRIAGTSEHSHTVTVTPSMFTSLQNNESVVVGSSTDVGHAHSITIVCA